MVSKIASAACFLVICMTMTGCNILPGSRPITGTHADLRSGDTRSVWWGANAAAKSRDWAAVPYLIANLDSDEPQIRLASHHSLLQIYHGRGVQSTFPRIHGYNSANHPADRRVAIQRWHEWWLTKQKELAKDSSSTDNQP